MEGRIVGYSDGKICGVILMNGFIIFLYVIDGFLVEKIIFDGLGNWVENVFDLNIEDIENIMVLKDVVVMFIYGVCVVNGVVVIIIKKVGKNQLNVLFLVILIVCFYNFYIGYLVGMVDMIEMEKEWVVMNFNF